MLKNNFNYLKQILKINIKIILKHTVIKSEIEIHHVRYTLYFLMSFTSFFLAEEMRSCLAPSGVLEKGIFLYLFATTQNMRDLSSPTRD